MAQPPSYVIDRMSVPGHDRVYVLGCRARRVTVLSQQYRAFNLIWALFESGRLREGDRVGIVGGGIGGLTTAAAAMMKACRVVLTEERDVLMPLQRGNTTRLIHPNIYEWPSEGSENDSTTFPYMNWTADIAKEVVKSLDNQWRAAVSKFGPVVHRGAAISKLVVDPDGLIRLANAAWESEPCHAVVVAVGFGTEGRRPTYWESESLAEPNHLPHSRRVLISGVGDGGLIDVLRLKYEDFDHVTFAAAVVRQAELAKYKEDLLAIDRELPPIDAEVFLASRYESLNIPADLAYKFGTLRKDTRVVLAGRRSSPLSPNAAILHRVVIWSLVRARELEYHAANIDADAIEIRNTQSGAEHWVRFPSGDKRCFDDVLLRHGPTPCLQRVEGVGSAFAGIDEHPSQDETRWQLYPDSFYPTAEDLEQAADPPVRQPAAGASPADEPAQPPFVALHGGETQRAIDSELVELLSVIENVEAELDANNFYRAAGYTARLDHLLVVTEARARKSLIARGYEALINFESQNQRQQAGMSGTKRDTTKLKELAQRMEDALKR